MTQENSHAFVPFWVQIWQRWWLGGVELPYKSAVLVSLILRLEMGIFPCFSFMKVQLSKTGKCILWQLLSHKVPKGGVNLSSREKHVCLSPVFTGYFLRFPHSAPLSLLLVLWQLPTLHYQLTGNASMKGVLRVQVLYLIQQQFRLFKAEIKNCALTSYGFGLRDCKLQTT